MSHGYISEQTLQYRGAESLNAIFTYARKNIYDKRDVLASLKTEK